MKTDFIYDKINEIVIKGLETKGLKWFKPWTNPGGEIVTNMNYTTRTPYHGVNVFILNSVAREFGYPTGEWTTYKQAAAAGGQVRKGESGTMIVYWSPFWYVKSKKKYFHDEAKLRKAGFDPASPDVEKGFNLRYYTVFNIAQCDDLESKIPVVEEPIDLPSNTPIERAQKIYDEYPNHPKVSHSNLAQAFYRPATDTINMPELDQFVDSDSYYKVLFHEAIHSTGHDSRLGRKTLVDMVAFGDKNYCREELVAEIGSMYLVGIADLDPKDALGNSQAYINGWVKYLKEHAKEVTYAMNQAAKATNHILNIKS